MPHFSCPHCAFEIRFKESNFVLVAVVLARVSCWKSPRTEWLLYEILAALNSYLKRLTLPLPISHKCFTPIRKTLTVMVVLQETRWCGFVYLLFLFVVLVLFGGVFLCLIDFGLEFACLFFPQEE